MKNSTLISDSKEACQLHLLNTPDSYFPSANVGSLETEAIALSQNDIGRKMNPIPS